MFGEISPKLNSWWQPAHDYNNYEYPFIFSRNPLLINLNQNPYQPLLNSTCGLSVAGTNIGNVGACFEAYSSTGNSGGLYCTSARGTQSSPAATQAGDQIGFVSFGGYNSSASALSKAVIFGYAYNNWTTSDNSSYLSFDVTASGATSRSEVMRIAENGGVVIGNSYVTTLPYSSGLSVQGNVLIGQPSLPSSNISNAYLGVTCGNTKSTAGIQTSININSTDSSSALELTFGLYGSATSGNQGGYIEATIPGSRYNPIYINQGGGGVAMGYSNSVAPPSGGAIIYGQVGIGTSSPNSNVLLQVGSAASSNASIQISCASGITFSSSTPALDLFTTQGTYRIGLDTLGATVGYIRYNISGGALGNTWGHCFSLDNGAPNGPYTNILFVGGTGVGVGTTTPTGSFNIALNSTTYICLIQGTASTTTSVVNNVGLYNETIMSTSAAGTTSYGLLNNPVFNVTGSGTYSNIFGAHLSIVSSSGATAAYTLYVTVPNGATSNYTAYFDSIVGIGATPNTISSLNVASTNAYNIYLSGTQTAVDSNNTQNVICNTGVLKPAGTSGTVSAFSAAFTDIGSYIANSGATITSAASFYSYPTLSSNVGTISAIYGYYFRGFEGYAGTATYAYGAYFNDPGSGTNHAALFCTNLLVNVAGVTPLAGEAIIAGQLQVGNTLSPASGGGAGSIKMNGSVLETNSEWMTLVVSGTTYYVPLWSSIS